MTIPGQRDPRIDPQPGDCIMVSTGKRTLIRRIVRRNGNDIYYRTELGTEENNCWITTWQNWAAKGVTV